MATLKARSRRGRPMSALRVWARETLPKIGEWNGAQTITVTVGKTKQGKPDTMQVKDFPKNAVIIPKELTDGKSRETSAEIVRLGKVDAQAKVTIETLLFTDASGKDGFLLYAFKPQTKQEPKNAPKQAPKKSAKKVAKQSTTRRRTKK